MAIPNLEQKHDIANKANVKCLLYKVGYIHYLAETYFLQTHLHLSTNTFQTR